jgi:hypothetical protein
VVRRVEIRRLALGQAWRVLKDNREQLLAIAHDITPGLWAPAGVTLVRTACATCRLRRPAIGEGAAPAHWGAVASAAYDNRHT